MLIFGLSTNHLSAQCATWEGNAKIDDAKNAHSIYRQAIKTKDYDLAFKNWQIAYDIAPAADGKRDYHFIDGAGLYKQMFEQETDEAKKKEYAEKAIALYDEAIACYKSKGIILKQATDENYQKKIGFVEGRKAFDMFYTFGTPHAEVRTVLETAVEVGGNDTEYIVFAPYTEVVLTQFTNDNMDKATARGIYDKLNAIADYNIENNQKLGSYYKQAKESMNGRFTYIERQIFDCDYFVEKLRPEYEADPDNPDVIKKTLAILKGQGCEPGNAMYDELDGKWKQYAAEENARRQAEFEASNPRIMARKAYDAGDFPTAISKYREAIAEEEDAEKKASYLFSIASIQFRKLNELSNARATAQEAASLRPNWGRPHMLIGDMYGKSSRNCGDAWNQRLVVLKAIETYQYAKSVDAEVAGDATDRISKYRASMPDKNEGFMRGVKEGQKVSVGCWIGGSVTVRYAN